MRIRQFTWWGAIVAVGAVLAGMPEALTEETGFEGVERRHPEEVRLLEELAAWNGDGASGDRLDPFPDAPSLASAVRARSQSFTLFCRESAERDSGGLLLSGLPFAVEITRAANRHRVDALLLAAIIEAESSFDPTAVSPQGALGLMQVMPTTAQQYGVENPSDPNQNVDAGARYLRGLLGRFDGDLPLALAAYNAGPGSVVRYGGMPPFPETTRYVDRVLRRYLDHRQTVMQTLAPGSAE